MFEVLSPINWQIMIRELFANQPIVMNRKQRRKTELHRKKRKKNKIRRNDNEKI